MYANMKPEERLNLLETLIEKSDIGFVIINQEHQVIDANSRFVEMLGYDTLEEVLGLCTWDYEHLMSKEQIVKNFEDLSSITQRVESVHRRKDGSTYTVEVIMGGGSFTKDNGVYKAVMCICQDITVRLEREESLRYLSLHDQLTGVYNRVTFDEMMEQYHKVGSYPVSLLLCDVNDLKKINDQYGHVNGDETLRSAAILIEGALRKADTIARYGGDEFVVILPDTGELDAQKVIQRIEERIRNHRNRTHPIPLSIAIGVATAYDRSQPLSETFEQADRAMYVAKEQKKDKKDKIEGSITWRNDFND